MRSYNVVKGDRVDDAELAEVVLEGRVVAMPCNHVKRRVILFCTACTIEKIRMGGRGEGEKHVSNNGD